jgi:hypothetical protein
MTAAPNGAAALARDLFAFTVLVVFVVGVSVVLPDLSAAVHDGGTVRVAERGEG